MSSRAGSNADADYASRHERGDRRRAPADRRGRAPVLRRGRERRRRLHRRGVRLLGRREPAHRPGGGRLHARPPRARPHRPPARLLRRAARASGSARPARPHMEVDRRRLRRRHAPGLPHRRGLVRRARARSPASRPRTAATARCRGASLLEPAIELARDGVELTPPQAYLHAILDLILRHTDGGPRDLRPAGRAPRRRRPARDARPRRRRSSCSRRRRAASSTRASSAGDRRRIQRAAAALITARRPRRVPRHPAPPDPASPSAGSEFVSNPPPSSGGVLIAYGLRAARPARRRGGPAGAPRRSPRSPR